MKMSGNCVFSGLVLQTRENKGLFGKGLTNTTIFGRSKLKVFADNKINVNQKLKFALGRIENIVGLKMRKYLLPAFLAPLAIGQRAYVMVCCPSCVRLSVR